MWRATSILFLLGLSAPVLAQEAGLTSPAIDRDMFRDGEVTRLQQDYADWRLVCDEVKKLHQRFCSLRSFARDGSGHVIARIVVSTSDDGRPAALLTLPFGLSLKQPVLVGTIPKTGKAKPLRFEAKPVLCAQDGCKIIWPMTGAHIMALRKGADVNIAFAAAPPSDFPGPMLVRAHTVQGWIAGAGFEQAIAASLQ